MIRVSDRISFEPVDLLSRRRISKFRTLLQVATIYFHDRNDQDNRHFSIIAGSMCHYFLIAIRDYTDNNCDFQEALRRVKLTESILDTTTIWALPSYDVITSFNRSTANYPKITDLGRKIIELLEQDFELQKELDWQETLERPLIWQLERSEWFSNPEFFSALIFESFIYLNHFLSISDDLAKSSEKERTSYLWYLDYYCRELWPKLVDVFLEIPFSSGIRVFASWELKCIESWAELSPYRQSEIRQNLIVRKLSIC